jgi:hypothetical protein
MLPGYLCWSSVTPGEIPVSEREERSAGGNGDVHTGHEPSTLRFLPSAFLLAPRVLSFGS